jgi:hypothetical protein
LQRWVLLNLGRILADRMHPEAHSAEGLILTRSKPNGFVLLPLVGRRLGCSRSEKN